MRPIFASAVVGILALVSLGMACGGSSNTQPLSTGSREPSVLPSSPTQPPTVTLPLDDRVRIPKIGIDAPLTLRIVGKAGGTLAAPKSADDIAIYDFSAFSADYGGTPGSGNTVLSAKLDSGTPCKARKVNPPCEAVFWDLNKLVPGDQVSVAWKKQSFNYTVVSLCYIDPKDFNSAIKRADGESLTLLTQAGTFNLATLSYSHWLVVRAARQAAASPADCAQGSAQAPPTPTPPAGPTPAPSDVTIDSVTSRVALGQAAEIKASAAPRARCKLLMFRGDSVAAYGANPSADATGKIAFSWPVPTSAGPGEGKVELSCGASASSQSITLLEFTAGLNMTPGKSTFKSNATYNADVQDAQLGEDTVRVGIAARGGNDLRKPETSCLIDLITGEKQDAIDFAASVSQLGNYAGVAVFPKSFLTQGHSYGFIYGCASDYSVAPLSLQ